MSVSPVSSSSVFQSQQSYFQNRQADLKQLGQALQSGDLAGAQQAYSAIVALRQNGPAPTSAPFLRPARQQAFAAIGQALQAGDLAGAQQAFAQLQNTFSFNHRIRVLDPIHPGGPTRPTVTLNLSEPASNADAAASAPSPASNPVSNDSPEVVVNLGSAAGNGEQITINLTNGSTGQGDRLSILLGNRQNPQAEQINIALKPNSNEHIVLNLFNSPATPANGSAVSVTA